jgi:hypothetical protein
MRKIALWGAALLLAAASPALAQAGGATAPDAQPKAHGAGPAMPPTVGGSPSGSSTAAPQADGRATAGSGGSRPTPAGVKEMLEQHGYTRVTDVTEGPDGYTASATKDGHEVELEIDPAGKISEKE